MGIWPWTWGRKRRKAKREWPGSPRARAAKTALQEQRRGDVGRPGRGSRYKPPPVPDDPSRLPRAYRAPQGPEVWEWVKNAPRDYFVETWREHDPEGFEDFRNWPRAEAPPAARVVRRHVLDLILAASREQYPTEFGAFLRAEKGVIIELMLLPGTVSGDSHAIFQFHMMPVDLSIVGTVHSHPSPVPYPSAADTSLFERHGRVHIITAYPFGPDDWRAFDHRSRMVRLAIVE